MLKMTKLHSVKITALLTLTGCSENPTNQLSENLKPAPQPQNVQTQGSTKSLQTESNSESKSNQPICNIAPRVAGEFKNIKYQSLNGIEDNLQSLDIYTPELTNPCNNVPVVIWVHGGGWMLGDKVHLDSKTEFYRSLGYVLVSINYRLSPVTSTLPKDSQLDESRIKFPDHPNDVGSAIAWVRKNITNYGGNPEQIALAGHSAGAHFVALVSTDQNYIRRSDSTWKSSFLKCTGSYDTEGYDIPTALASDPPETQKKIYQNAFGVLPADHILASPKTHISSESPAFQFAKRGDSSRQNILTAFSELLKNLGKTISIIDATSLDHEDVNTTIGAARDLVMTPYVREFMTRVCFPK